jgi:hypothetical protein
MGYLTDPETGDIIDPRKIPGADMVSQFEKDFARELDYIFSKEQPREQKILLQVSTMDTWAYDHRFVHQALANATQIERGTAMYKRGNWFEQLNDSACVGDGCDRPFVIIIEPHGRNGNDYYLMSIECYLLDWSAKIKFRDLSNTQRRIKRKFKADIALLETTDPANLSKADKALIDEENQNFIKYLNANDEAIELLQRRLGLK